jgi:hypothetical protein
MWVNQHNISGAGKGTSPCHRNVNSKQNYNFIDLGYPELMIFVVEYRAFIFNALKKFSFLLWIPV